MRVKGRLRLPVVTVFPSAPERGEVVYHVTLGVMFFDGSGWKAA